MAINSGVTKGTPAKIAFGAGVYFQGVTYSETTAPTEEEIRAGLLGATQEGGKITITPEFFSPDIDGVLVKMKEFEQKVSETATMETSMMELTPELIARYTIGKIADSTDGKYDVITSAELRSGHFYEGFGYYGNLLDGRAFICVFKNALCTSGFAMEGKNKENSKFAGTFECHSDIEYGVANLPYALFLNKESGWTPVTPDEIAETTE